jgi:acetyltransferase-like isoleucine patch superfamily enzyme
MERRSPSGTLVQKAYCMFGLFKRVLRHVKYRTESVFSNAALYLTPGISVRGRVSTAYSIYMSFTDGGECILENDVGLQRYVHLVARGGTLSIGARTHVGQGSVIVSREKIVIGADCLIAEYVTIRDHHHVFGRDQVTADSGFVNAAIIIEDNVWIGAKATILAGVTIGSGSVIGAGAVVTRDIPANCVATGVPAQVMRTLVAKE